MFSTHISLFLFSSPLSLSVIEAVPVQGKREEHSLLSTGTFLIGNTSLDYQRGSDRQTLRVHGPLRADYIIKVRHART